MNVDWGKKFLDIVFLVGNKKSINNAFLRKPIGITYETLGLVLDTCGKHQDLENFDLKVLSDQIKVGKEMGIDPNKAGYPRRLGARNVEELGMWIEGSHFTARGKDGSPGGPGKIINPQGQQTIVKIL